MAQKNNVNEEAEDLFGFETGDDTPEDEDEVAIIELEGERYEVIDNVTLDGRNFVALLPFEENEEFAEEAEFTLLEITDDPDNADNCILKTVDDEELYQRIGDAFLEHFGADED
ncbi:MAG: DUF1292 domain-containing protein [Ruminiclostridium sp.]|nr:DUF1292 domain-containing protein [Ruminiclostridium sp.]